MIEGVRTSDDGWCHGCGGAGGGHGFVVWWLAYFPLGWGPIMVLVRLPRYRCRGCGCGWRDDLGLAAGSRAEMIRAAVGSGREACVVRLSILRIVVAFGVAWGTAIQRDSRRWAAVA